MSLNSYDGIVQLFDEGWDDLFMEFLCKVVLEVKGQLTNAVDGRVSDLGVFVI